jgi:hypothetical protein
LRCQDAFDEIGLKPSKHRRHEDYYCNPNRNPADDKHRLHVAFLQEPDSHDPFEWHPSIHGITGLIR